MQGKCAIITYMKLVNGRYLYLEKTGKAAIILDGTRLLWSGEVGTSVPEGLVPIEVLLDFTTKANASRS